MCEVSDIKNNYLDAEHFVFDKKDIAEKKEHFPKLLKALKEMV